MPGEGATPEAWTTFDLELDLTADLLPVVSDQSVVISPHSAMKQLGKTPSRINGQGLATGFREWTKHESTPKQIARWAADDRLGICVQTRRVRALDIDVPDVRLADAIEREFLDALGVDELPTRVRASSGKRLLAFRLDGPLRKRSFKVDGGLVELLADGQQFIAAGTHPSGDRYEWRGGLPREIRGFDADDFERAWARIAERAIEPERRARELRPGAGVEDPGDDPVAQWLVEHDLTLGQKGDMLFVECPWKSGHSMDSGESETAWLIAGSSGYQRGHFKCMHASCANREDGDFLAEVGYVASQFSVVEVSAEEAAVEAAEARAPKLDRDSKNKNSDHRAYSTLSNLMKAIQWPPFVDVRLRYDSFFDSLMIAWNGDERWRPLRDTDITRLWLELTSGPARFKEISARTLSSAVALVGEQATFDTAQDWLEHLPAWDGVPRIERFWSRYFSTADTPYTRAVGLYSWTAQAGRIMEPGCQADMIPVIVGPQGCGKSSGVGAISPDLKFYAKVSLHGVRDADLSRKMRGKLVMELDELKGLRSRDAEWIKSWVTTTTEQWTPKFMEHEVTLHRRLVLYGTTNRDDFLGDDTGERRWLPVVCEGQVDRVAISRDRDQLWAEGLARWRKHGVMWMEAEELAKNEHANFKSRDVWDDQVSAWLYSTNEFQGVPPISLKWTIGEIFERALRLDPVKVSKNDEHRLAAILHAHGMKNVQKGGRRDRRRFWCSVDPNADLY